MSGKRARANRRMNERIAELRDMADVAQEMVEYCREEGREADARSWAAFARALYRGADPVIDGTTAELEKLARGRAWIEDQMVREVRALRADAVSWLRIGSAMGMSGQGALKWYSRRGGEAA